MDKRYYKKKLELLKICFRDDEKLAILMQIEEDAKQEEFEKISD